jgi:hypothetical protein
VKSCQREGIPAIGLDVLTRHIFASLIVAAIVWYAAKGPLIGIGLLVGLFWSLNWLCHRFPRTMYWIVLIVGGLMSGLRRR